MQREGGIWVEEIYRLVGTRPLRESIPNPGDQTAGGPSYLLPANGGDRLSDGQLEILVASIGRTR